MSAELRVLSEKTKECLQQASTFTIRHSSLVTRHSARGFGILETLLASGVLITVVSAVVGLGSAAVRAGQGAADRQIAYHLANEAVEIMRQTRDSRWIDGDGQTTWNVDDTGAGVFGFCTEFPITSNSDHACGGQDTGASGELELFFNATLQKWQALYCDQDNSPTAYPDCYYSVAAGGTLGEGAGAGVLVNMGQDSVEKTEIIYLTKDGKLLDNSHGALVNDVYKLNTIDQDDPVIARVFERKVRLRQVQDPTQGGLCDLPSCTSDPGDTIAIGPQAIQVTAQVSWEAQGRRESVESSTILTNWNPEF